MKFEQTTIYANIDRLIENNIPFALYRLPQQSKVTLVVQECGEVTCLDEIEKLDNRVGFIVAPFCLDGKHPLVCIRPDKVMDINSLTTNQVDKWVSKINTRTCSKTIFKATSKEDYCKTFDTFLGVLRRNEFEKLVLSRSCDYPKKVDFSLGKTFEKACGLYPLAYTCLCHTPQTGTWLGCSPELLLSSRGSTYKTVALAGTQKVDSVANWDQKNKLEQEIVSNYIRKQLKDSGYNFVEAKRLNVHAGNLVHLKTEFEFEQTKVAHMGTILAKLHPTPAVCGFPKEEARRYIFANEGYDRAYYSGFWGYIDPKGESNLYVNIRCIWVNEDSLRLYAGGGLLSSSSFETEWRETEEKLQTMLALI